jgi:DNA-binding XRE family transcriptional regulator
MKRVFSQFSTSRLLVEYLPFTIEPRCARLGGRLEVKALLQVDSDKLRRLREGKVLTMEQIAELAGVSYNTVYRLEHGRSGARQRSIKALARVLGVAPQELLANGKT